MDGEMRARFAQRMHRMAAEIAASMHSFDSVLEALRTEREGAQGGDAVGVAAGDSAEPRGVTESRGVVDSRGVTESRGVVDSRGGHTLRNIAVLARLAARRDALLEAEGVADRDAALRDAVAGGRLLAPDEAHGADRVVVLLADPEPVQRALLERLGESGVSVEVCVHSVESIDRAGFPQLGAWESRRFPVERIPSSSIRVAEGPAEAADAVVEAIRRLLAPRRSDAIAVMAPDDESRRAIERALALAGAPATRVASRGFPATRLGTLLARLGDLLGEGTLESLAAFVRHDDVATWLAREACDGAETVVTEYRAETLAGSWRDAVVGEGKGDGGGDGNDGGNGEGEGTRVGKSSDHSRTARIARRYAALVGRVRRLVAPLAGRREARAWARPLRDTLRAIVGGDMRGAFATERAATIRLLDRTLRELDEVPAGFRAPLACREAIALVLAELAGKSVRESARDAAGERRPDSGQGDSRDDGLTIFGWLDAGMADERHLVLAGFADGRVPEGAVVDPILPDELRRRLGMPSSLRRAARDAWILDGILERARARAASGDGVGASVSFVVPRRTAEGDPLRPSRFLLRVGREDLAARVMHLFPTAHAEPVVAAADAAPRAGDAVFPRTPAIAGTRIRAVSVTAFKTYLQCPYLFQLRTDPRLRLEAADERAVELDARGFGVLVHAAVERWGREELDAGTPTTDATAIERALVHHLERYASERFPPGRIASVDVQIALARRRLERFARLQAEQAAEGWRLHAVETSFEVEPGAGATQAPMLAAAGAADGAAVGKGLLLTGRIDRVDVHPDRGIFRALDYKTSSNAESPTKTHRVVRGPNKGQWKDLQLPLYRVLLRSMPAPIAVDAGALGYINLAPSMEKSGFEFLEASDLDLDAAEAQASEIVARILAGDFTPSARIPVRPDDPLGPVWGLGFRVLDDDEARGGDETRGGGGEA